MQNSALAQKAYGEAALPIRAERDIEFQAFAKTTRALREYQANPAPEFKRLAEAVLQNRKLWTVLTADLAQDGNGLPDGLRAQLISLGLFVQQHSVKVLSDNADIEVLIDINTAIMRGLRQGSDA